MTFAAALKKAQTAKVPFQDVPVMIGDELFTFRFRRMNGLDWASEIDKYPARPGVLIDSTYGYNIRALTEGVAPKCGVRVEGTTEVPLRVDPVIPGSDEPRVDEWADLFAVIGGHNFQRITDAIWWLNERSQQEAVEQAVESAKKAPARSSKASA